MPGNRVRESFLIHTSTDIAYADPTVCSLLGVDGPDQLRDHSVTDLVTPECREQLREQISRIEAGEAPALGMTVTFHSRRGQTQRAVVLSRLMAWDGTEQVQTSIFPIPSTDADSLRLLYDEAMDEAPIGITISDPSQPDNPLIYVNDGFTDLTGYPRDEILGRNCRFLQGANTREEPVRALREAIDAEEPVTVDLRNYRTDGTMFWNRVTIVPIRSESGTVTNYLGYQQDVTFEKRYKRDLSLFKEQAEQSDNAIVITDPAGTIEYVNPAFERLTGYTAAEARGRTPRILKSGQQDDAFYENLWTEITAGEVWEADLINQTKHGELFEARHKIVPVTDVHGEITHFVGITEDVTEEVLTTQTIDVLNRILRHNLRNSLNAIEGHAELLETETLDPDTRQASLAAIRNQASSLRQLSTKTDEIRQIWDHTVDHRRWDRLETTSLLDTYRELYPNAEIGGSIHDAEQVQVRNAALLQKAIDEAVENAIKHCDQSPPVVEITVRRDADANRLRIEIADNGPGIPDIDRAAIERGGETPLAHSLGVGLWLMEWIATTLGGNLTITDNEPRGSVVTFELPVGGDLTGPRQTDA